MTNFHNEVDLDKKDAAAYRKKALSLIDDGKLFFWVDENGERVSMASFSISDGKGRVGSVYTPRDKRRRGYAANLFYAVTLIVKSLGKTPTLYTNADYVASNACYKALGYKKRGSLCTIE